MEPLSHKQLQLRSIVGHGNTYMMMKKYQRKLLLAKTPAALVKAAKEYQKAFFEHRENGTFQRKYVKIVNKFKL